MSASDQHFAFRHTRIINAALSSQGDGNRVLMGIGLVAFLNILGLDRRPSNSILGIGFLAQKKRGPLGCAAALEAQATCGLG